MNLFFRAVPHVTLAESRALSTRRVSHKNGDTVVPFVICGHETRLALAGPSGYLECAWSMFVHLPRFRRSQ
jgi:hypothetical protein